QPPNLALWPSRRARPNPAVPPNRVRPNPVAPRPERRRAPARGAAPRQADRSSQSPQTDGPDRQTRRGQWLLKLIRAFLNAGVMENGLVSSSVEGTPQGGPLSPLLSDLVLDELDRELE